MGRKRRQRSTTIRKRIEKHQREKAQAAKKKAKLAAKERGEDLLVRMEVPAGPAKACSVELEALEKRLSTESIRGWTASDLSDEFGLTFLGRLLGTACDEQPDEHMLVVDFPDDAKGHLLDRLSALELAATGLSVDWEQGFTEVARSINKAEEQILEEDEESA